MEIKKRTLVGILAATLISGGALGSLIRGQFQPPLKCPVINFGTVEDQVCRSSVALAYGQQATNERKLALESAERGDSIRLWYHKTAYWAYLACGDYIFNGEEEARKDIENMIEVCFFPPYGMNME